MSFLDRRSVGVSITDQEIEIVEVGIDNDVPKVIRSVQIPLSPSIVENSAIVDREALTKAFTQALTKTKGEPFTFDEVVCALPTPHTYSGLVSVSDEKDDTAIEKSIEEHIQDTVPLARSDVLFSYVPTKVKDKDGKSNVFFVATSKEVVMEWRSFFKAQNSKASFAFGPLAGYHALSLPSDSDAITLVDMTGLVSTISVFSGGIPYYNFGRRFGKNDSALVSEIKDASTQIRDAYDKNPNTLILAVPSDDDVTKAQLEKELEIQVVSPTIRVEGHESFRLVTLGAALCGLGEKNDGIDASFFVEKANKLHAPSVSEEEDEKQITDSGRDKSKLRRQMIILGIIVLVGLFLLGGAFWLQSDQKEEDVEEEVATEQELAVATSTETATTTEMSKGDVEEENKQIGVIKETPTGWLNVRSGPNLSDERVGRVLPGDSYTILETSGEWYQIEFSGDEKGWIFSEYVTIE